MRGDLRKFLGRTLFLFFLMAASGRGAADSISVATANPWISLLVGFIGGKNVTIIPLREWGPDGGFVYADKGRTLKSLPHDAMIIALDAKEAGDVGIEKYPNLYRLYERFPVIENDIDAMLSDPSVLPFVAQRVLMALSQWDVPGYPYYQRRLAEFQARLFGAVMSGQQVLRGATVCNLSGSSGALLKASGCLIMTPEPERLVEWGKGRYAGLKELVSENWENGVVTITDGATPRAVQKFLNGRPGTFRFDRPALNQDYTAFLHDQYIALWQMVSARRKILNDRAKK